MAHVYSYLHIGEPLKALAAPYSQVWIVADECFRANLDELFHASEIPTLKGIWWQHASEAEKSMETAEKICEWLLENKAERGALLIGIGGGIITDLTGFVGAIYKRGMPVGYVPTTLLSMIDAGVGGKTGVNFGGHKNMLGVIRQPVFVDLLQSVCAAWPDSLISDGYSEAIKMDLLKSRFQPFARDINYFRTIEHIAEYTVDKLHIIEQDPDDLTGIRAQLNLGHTYAHALEAISHGAISHGSAVGTGLVMVARTEELKAAIKADLEAHNVPLHLDEYPLEALTPYIKNDKKAAGGKVAFIEIPPQSENLKITK